MQFFTLAAAALAGLVASQPVPLPNTMDGFLIGSPSAPVQVEAFTDLLCPDCAAGAYESFFLVFVDRIGALIRKSTYLCRLVNREANCASLRQQGVRSPSHLPFAIPHLGIRAYNLLHCVLTRTPRAILAPLLTRLLSSSRVQKAAMTAQVLAALNTSNPNGAVISFADLMYSGVQQNFWNDAVAANTTSEVEMLYAQTAATLGYSVSDVMNGLQNSDYDEAARVAWKYGTSRYTTGTPHYLVNGRKYPPSLLLHALDVGTYHMRRASLLCLPDDASIIIM